MNKTVNINLAGIVFHIDEDAFEILNNYLNALKNHFKNEEGADEILKDIEGRIAELFTERLDKKEAISIADVNEVTAIMGNPSDYDDDFIEEKVEKTEDLLKNKRKRIFRDEDERMIGGVCSGLGNYFDINVFWFRIIFLALLFTVGGGTLIYIILWIAIPSAKTTAEKLEMKGEKVNISNIEKNIKDELDNLETKVKDFDKKVTSEYGSKAVSFVQKITDLFISLFKGIFKFLGSCFGIFAVVIGGILLFVIVSALLSNGIIFLEINQLLSYIFESGTIPGNLKAGLVLFIGIPIISVILFGLKLVNNTTIHSNHKIALLFLWLASWVILGSSGTNIAAEFQKNAKHSTTEIINFQNDTLYLSMNDVDREFDIVFDAKGFKVSPFEDELIGIGMRLDLKESQDSIFSLIKEATAFGKSKSNAKISAQGVSFNFLVEDDNLIFDDFFSIEEQKWRMQELDLTLEIPIGKVIYLDHSIEDLIYDIKNQENMWDYDMLGHYWKMEKEGLSCISCR
ncbi:MAG: PspC domain-containing protein [Flavobacteriales bacterium]|nr:PspC domain-containing protein [Flavobacteriales bacterium]